MSDASHSLGKTKRIFEAVCSPWGWNSSKHIIQTCIHSHSLMREVVKTAVSRLHRSLRPALVSSETLSLGPPFFWREVANCALAPNFILAFHQAFTTQEGEKYFFVLPSGEMGRCQNVKTHPGRIHESKSLVFTAAVEL